MWNDFGEYISKLYDKNPTKIAEIAIGKYEGVFNYLNKQEHIKIIKTDITPNNNDVIKDDITNPNLDLYKDLDIIYSIRPPSELHPYLIKLQKKINATLIIKPLTNEDLNTPNTKMQLRNYKKASFYILERR